MSPCTIILSIFFSFLLSQWYDIIRRTSSALIFIDDCLNGIKYPHTFYRRPRDFKNYQKWKASELRCFMIYTALPIFIKLCLNVSNCFPRMYISHFLLLFIYLRVLRVFSDSSEIRNMSEYIHVYLDHFSFFYQPCKELYSVHALVHLWEQVEQHGGLAFHR